MVLRDHFVHIPDVFFLRTEALLLTLLASLHSAFTPSPPGAESTHLDLLLSICFTEVHLPPEAYGLPLIIMMG